ncbi:hypothetical protein E4U12_006173 [Claviceps purpurea]|nr:hypothetical protein E4U12_006173 [Claviceps purpurea]
MSSSVFLFVPGNAWISRTPLGLGARILRPLCPEGPDDIGMECLQAVTSSGRSPATVDVVLDARRN